MSFTLTVPKEAHADLTEQLAKLSHVHLHTDEHPGMVTASDGTKFHYRPKEDGTVLVDILENPHNVPEEKIKEALEKQLLLLNV